MRKKRMIITCLLLLAAGWLQAQPADTARLMQELNRLTAAYQGQSIAFRLHYTYANEQQPGAVLDSIDGEMELSGADFYSRIDSMETFVNARYQVILFREDKLMHLSRRPDSASAHPASQMVMMVRRYLPQSWTVQQTNGRQQLQINFADDEDVKSILLQSDVKTGWLTEVRYVVKTSLLMPDLSPAGTQPDGETYGAYALVTMRLDGYRKITPGSIRNHEQNFFTRVGDELTPADTYKDYTIFKATPNL